MMAHPCALVRQTYRHGHTRLRPTPYIANANALHMARVPHAFSLSRLHALPRHPRKRSDLNFTPTSRASGVTPSKHEQQHTHA